MDIAAQLDAVGPPALTALVRRALGSQTAEAGEWRCHPLHGGLGGASGGLCRVAGTARDGGGDAPWSLVLKVVRPPGPDGPAPPMATEPRATYYWRREPLAYESGLLGDLPGGLAAARCYGVDERPDGAVWLWLEELRDDAGRPWPLDRYALAARHLGRFNGAYLAGRPLPAHPWLCADFLTGWFAQWARAAEVATRAEPWERQEVRAAFPVPVAGRVRRLIADRDRLREGLARLPRTLCHHDAWYRNLFARGDADERGETVAVDWAYVGIGPLGADGGDLLAGSMFYADLDAARAVGEEPAVFEAYWQGLREAGWRGDRRHARFGYAASAALRWGVPAWLPFIQEDPGRRRMEQFLGRPLAELLPQWATVQYWLLDLADEARGLLGTLR